MKRKGKFIIIVLLAIIGVFITLCISVYNRYYKEPNAPDNTNASDVQTGLLPALPRNEKVKIQDEAASKRTVSSFTTQTSSKGTIKENSNLLYLPIGNSPVNKLDCFIEIKIDGKYLYTSALIKPGTYLEKIKLKKKLSKGIHQGLVRQITVYRGKTVSCYETAVPIICS